ncbi:MAG: type II toxin-antitoxin system RelE family toxin [Actinomycetota bacterium]
MSRAAEKAYVRLPEGQREKVKEALLDLAEQAGAPGRGGKKTKGAADTFHRLRVGDYRVMYDVLEKETTILVLGIINRGELESWLRSR